MTILTILARPSLRAISAIHLCYLSVGPVSCLSPCSLALTVRPGGMLRGLFVLPVTLKLPIIVATLDLRVSPGCGRARCGRARCGPSAVVHTTAGCGKNHSCRSTHRATAGGRPGEVGTPLVREEMYHLPSDLGRSEELPPMPAWQLTTAFFFSPAPDSRCSGRSNACLGSRSGARQVRLGPGAVALCSNQREM